MVLIPGNTEQAVCYRWYQRRTLTGIGCRKKTVRSCTGKTPRTIVAARAATSASIMVRFFCILVYDVLLVQFDLTPQRKHFFEIARGFLL